MVNDIRRDFDEYGRLISERQSHDGPHVWSTTPKVQYTYTAQPMGANIHRPASVVYPSGYTVEYNYDSGLDDAISRLSSLSDSSGGLEEYEYLGLGTVVRRARPQPEFELTFLKQGAEPNGDAGDQYAGLDQFGRISDHRWIDSTVSIR